MSKFISSFNLGQIWNWGLSGWKLGDWVKSWKKLLYTLKGTVLIQSSWNFVRMFISMKSSSDLKLGHIVSKIRSRGQILENYVYILEVTVLIKCSKYMSKCLSPWEKGTNLKVGHVGSETRSLGQILEKSCVHSRGHSFDQILMKLCQNINLYGI